MTARLVHQSSGAEVHAGETLTARGGDVWVFVKWALDGAGSGHVWVRRETARETYMFRPNGFCLSIVDAEAEEGMHHAAE